MIIQLQKLGVEDKGLEHTCSCLLSDTPLERLKTDINMYNPLRQPESKATYNRRSITAALPVHRPSLTGAHISLPGRWIHRTEGSNWTDLFTLCNYIYYT